MKYYISCPVSVDYEQIVLTEKLIKTHDPKAQVEYWERNSVYSEGWIEECDVFIILFPANRFRYVASCLPTGVLREFKKARVLRKKIYLVYRSETIRRISIYNTEHNIISDIIEGIPGTGNKLFLEINTQLDHNKYPLTPQECYPAPTMQEKRLLLFLK